MTIARMVRQFKAPSTLALSRSGLREMEDRDVPAVTELFTRYTTRFDMVPLLEEDDVRHQFLSGRGKGERETSTGRRQGQVVWAYVVEVSFTTTFLFQQFYNGALESGISRHYRLLLVLYLAIDGRVEPAA